MLVAMSSPLSMLNYNYSIAATSSNVNILVSFDNYIDSSTFLDFSYNGGLITIGMSSGSFFNVILNGNGSKSLTGWNGVTLGTSILTNIQIINPSFSLSYTITAISYFI